MVKKVLLVLVLAGITSSMFACNTTKGVGQDMQSGGQSLEKSARQNGAQ